MTSIKSPSAFRTLKPQPLQPETAVERAANLALRWGSEVWSVDERAVSPVITGFIRDSVNQDARELGLSRGSGDLHLLYAEAAGRVVEAFRALGYGSESTLGASALRAQSELREYGHILEAQNEISLGFSRLGPQAVSGSLPELAHDLATLSETGRAHAAPCLHDVSFASFVEQSSDSYNRDLRRVGDEAEARGGLIPSSVIVQSGDATLIRDMEKAQADTFNTVIAALTHAAPGVQEGPARPRTARPGPKVDGSEPALELSSSSLRYVAQVGFELAQLDRAGKGGGVLDWSRYPNARRVLTSMDTLSSSPGAQTSSHEPAGTELSRHIPAVLAVLEGLRLAAEQNGHKPFAHQVATPYGLKAGEVGAAILKALPTVERDGRATAPQAFARAQKALSEARGGQSGISDFDQVFVDYLKALKTAHGFSLGSAQGAEVRDAVRSFAEALTRGPEAR